MLLEYCVTHFSFPAFQKKPGGLKFRLYDQFWSYAVPKKKFRKLIAQFVDEAYPVLREKIIRDIGKDFVNQREEWNISIWFQIWLAYTSDSRIGIRSQYYTSLNNELYKIAELESLRMLPWTSIVRNVPTLFWLQVDVHKITTFVHLAKGQNIRKMPGYTHYSKKMAHIFHSCNEPTFSMTDHGAHAFVLSLGDKISDNNWQLRSLYFRMIGEEYTADRLQKMVPFMKRMIQFVSNDANISQTHWEMIQFFVADKWTPESKQFMKYRTLATLIKAAGRHFEQLEEQINLKKLLKDYDYSPSTAWPARDTRSWNLMTDEAWFRIVELRTSTDLLLEGAKMHHCVGDYVESCLTDNNHIFSLRKRSHRQTKWRSIATMCVIEDSIVEMSGLLNAELDTELESYINTWATNDGLVIDLD